MLGGLAKLSELVETRFPYLETESHNFLVLDRRSIYSTSVCRQNVSDSWQFNLRECLAYLV